MIKGVHSVIVWTEDIARLLPFYRDTLGLRTEMDTPEFVVFAADRAPSSASASTARSKERRGTRTAS